MRKSLIIFYLALGVTACTGNNTTHHVAISNPHESPRSIGPSPTPTAKPHINREELALPNGLSIKRREINLENNKRHYKVSVVYPEVEGSPNEWSKALNNEIKRKVTKTYQWLLEPPTKDDLLHYSKWPGVFNSVDMEYDVVELNDRFLSFYFMGYHYGIGAAHSVHESFTVNYDLRTHQILSFTDLFKSKSQALKLISETCIEQLSKNFPYRANDLVSNDNLKPKAENFESWNLTTRGLRLNFDACKIAGCADGDLQVEIPIEHLSEISRPGGLLGKPS